MTDPATDNVGEMLRQLRKKKKLTGVELAERIGVSQASISKIETGIQAASLDFVVRFCDAVGVSKRQAKSLFAAVNRSIVSPTATTTYSPFGFATIPDAEKRQTKARAAELEADLIRVFQPTAIDGLLQTRDYAKHIMLVAGVRPDTINASVEERIRRQRILKDQKKSVEFVITESSLRNRICPTQVMFEQCMQLSELLRKQEIEVTLLPQSAKSVELIFSGFTLLDDREVYIELSHGEFGWTDKETISFYERKFRGLQRSGLTGSLAIRFLHALCEDYEALLKAENRTFS